MVAQQIAITSCLQPTEAFLRSCKFFS